jgi:glycine/D-amino acid oxidase-like deaminating enzyme
LPGTTLMPIEVNAVPSDETLPDKAEIVVIGGGIAGVSTTLFLAERGIDVLLCEKGIIAGEQSSRNWGWCRAMGRDPHELPLMLHSLQLWRGMNQRVRAETGFRQTGTIYACPTPSALAQQASWLPHAEAAGLDTRLIGREGLADLLPGAALQWEGGLHTASDGVAEPALAAPAIAQGARAAGAKIVTHCAVRGLETTGGRISAVITEKGRVRCQVAVLAGGAWSGLFCRSLGLRLPQLKLLESVSRTAPIAAAPKRAFWAPGLAFRPRLDGGYTISDATARADIVPDSFRYASDFLPLLKAEWSATKLRIGAEFFAAWRRELPWALDAPSPFEQVRTLDPAPDRTQTARALRAFTRAFPALEGVKILRSWAGLIDTTPDMLPVISTVAALPGLVISTGYSGHGFGIGPGAGWLTADLAMGTTPIVDPAPFRLARFGTG